MGVRRIDHLGIVVDDLEAAVAFFAAIGLEEGGREDVDGDWVDRIVGLEGVKAELAFVQTADGHGRLELVKFHSPPGVAGDQRAPSNMMGIRHVALAVDDLDAAVAAVRARGAELVGTVESYKNVFRLCYVRGPAGIIVELAQPLD